MNHKRNFTLSAIVSIGLVNLIAFGTAFTAAAFLNYELHSQEINIDLGYSKYFSSIDPNKPADGSQANPYLITNATQLRNLSSLVNLGVFSPNDYFRIPKAGFTYDNIPLTPIGNEQQPFVSHFDGEYDIATPNTVPVITNLIVEGNNLPDVGMFGYIGNSATVSNFILDNPIIRSYEKINDTTFRPANEGFNWKDIDKNPLRDIPHPTDTTKKLLGPETCETISLTTTDTENVKTNKIMHNFSINVSEVAKLIKHSGLKLNLYPVISDTNLITQPDPNSPFTFKTAEKVPIPLKPNSKQNAEGKYCTISVAVSGVAPFGTEHRFTTIILERYKLFFNYDKDIAKEGITVDEQDFKTYSKMKYPETFFEETLIEDETNETSYYGYIKYDEVRALYVGIIAGQIDGEATRIGVRTPKLDIQRPFISNSMLFGKTIDDTNKRTLSHEEFINDNVLLNGATLTYKWIEPKLIDFLTPKGKKVDDPDHGTGNNYVSDIYDLDPKNPKQGFTKSAQNIIRIYADNENGVNQSKNKPKGTGVVGVTDKVSYFDNVTSKNEVYDATAISIQKPMNVKLHSPVSFTTDTFEYRNGFKNALISDAIQLWISSQHTRSRVNDWFNGSVEFYLDCEIEYLYFDNMVSEITIPTVSGDFKAHNILQVYAGEKSLRPKRLAGRKGPKHNYALPRTIPAVEGLNHDVELEKLSDAIKYKIDDDITNKASAYYAYPFAYLENTTDIDGNEISGFNNLKLVRSDSLDNAMNNQKLEGYEPSTMKFSIAANKSFTASDKSLPARIRTGFFPIFFLGLQDRTKINASYHNECRLDILSMNVTLSNKRGNIDSSTGTVDYIAGTTLPLKGKNSNYWNGTGVKINASTIKNTENLTTAPGLPIQRFAAINPEVNVGGGNHYYISISRNVGTNVVSVKYNPYNLASVLTIDTRDTPGFKISNPYLDNTLSF